MDEIVFFIGLLFVSFVLHNFSLGQVVINFEVEGNHVTKTGIRRYSVYRNLRTNEQDTTSISCFSPVSVPAKLVMTKNSELEAKSTTRGDDTTKIRVTREYLNYKTKANGIKGPSTKDRTKYTSPNDWTRGTTLAGVYICQLVLAVPIQNHSEPFIVTMRSEIEIDTEDQTYICSSSVGNFGYVGEIISLYCNGKYYDSDRSIDYSVDWLNSSNHHNVPLSYSYQQSACGYNMNVSVCQSPEIEVYQSLNVSIIPEHTGNLTYPLLTGYICRSNPPRLLHWAAIGKDGNILDPGNMYKSVKSGTTVTISQSVRETSLLITETVPGINGIHTITCSTYDTSSPVVTSISLVPLSVPGTDRTKNEDSTHEQTTTTASDYESTKTQRKDKYSTLSTGGTILEDSSTRQTTVETNAYKSTNGLHTRKDKPNTLPTRHSITKQTTTAQITKTPAHGNTIDLHKIDHTSSTLPAKEILSEGQDEIVKEYREDSIAIKPFKKDEENRSGEPGFSAGNIPVAFITLALLLVVGYIIFKKRRAPLKTEQTRGENDVNIESEIELHEYPSRLSFSEAFGYTERSREADKMANGSHNKYDDIMTETELVDNPAYQSCSDILEDSSKNLLGDSSNDEDCVPSFSDEESYVYIEV